MDTMPLAEDDEKEDSAQDVADDAQADTEEPDIFQNRAGDEELTKKFADEANENHNRFRSMRWELDLKAQIADYMYACAQNRSIMTLEKKRGMALEKDTRANVGSTLYFRQVNQLAAQLVNVMQSKPDLWEYAPQLTEDIQYSGEADLPRINAANALARWTRKQNGFDERMPEFAVMLFKYSNIFAGVRMVREHSLQTIIEPVFEEVGQDEQGMPRIEITGETKRTEYKVTKNYPEFFFPHPDMFWADRYIPNIKSQNCVVLGSIRNKSDLWDDAKAGYFDMEQYEKIGEGQQWNADAITSWLKRFENYNRELQYTPIASGMYMQWDVWMRAPIDEKTGEWDDKENPPRLWWATFIGNTIGEGICVRLQRNNEPDDEIPFKEVRCQPDNNDQLYHTLHSDIVRSCYSADCTLVNLALDNMGLVNDPPLTVIDGETRVRDFTFKKGALWHVDRHEAIQQFQVRDNTLSTSKLREEIRQEAMSALATDPAMMGQFAGARTSATEWAGVNQNTRQPHLLQIRYILHQLLPWMAKKMMRYWEAYGMPDQVAAVTHMDKQYGIRVKEVVGDFDVNVNIVDEYEDSMLKQQQVTQILTTIGNVPYFQQSPHHTTDPSELMKVWLNSMKWPASRIVLPPEGSDAQQVAMSRINLMLHNGAYARPQVGENFTIHLRVAQGERLRWKGLENSDAPQARNLHLLDQYIAEVQFMLKGGEQQQGGAPNGNIPQGQQNQTEGEAIGNQYAGAIGAAGGGQQ